MSLRSKLALVVIGSVLVTIVLLVSLLFVFSSAFLQGYTHVDLRQISQEAEQQLRRLNEWSEEAAREVLEQLAVKYEEVEMELLSHDGSLLYSSAGRTGAYSFGELADRFIDQPYNLFRGEDVHMMYHLDSGLKRHYLLLSVAGESLMNVQIYLYFNQYSSIPFLFIPLLLIILLPTLFVIGFIIRVNHRIKRLNAAMQQADLNHLSIHVDDESKDEIGQLASLFNAMSDKLSRQFAHIRQIEKSRQALISNLSHDLRTPLTSIKGYAETLQLGTSASMNDQHRYSTIIVQRAEYMEHLLNQLFEIALLDELPAALRQGNSNISKLVQTIVMEYAYILEDKKIVPDVQIPSAVVWVNLDEREVHQVVRNLVENAIQYGGEGHYVKLLLMIR